MINTFGAGSNANNALNQSTANDAEETKKEKNFRELGENDDSVYKVYDFSEYPSQMITQDRLVYQILLS